MGPAALLSSLSHHHIPLSERHQLQFHRDVLGTYIFAKIAPYLHSDLFQRQETGPPDSSTDWSESIKGILEVCGTGIVCTDQGEGSLFLGDAGFTEG